MAEEFYLNAAQIKGLAGMFFNLATGLILGGVGFAVVGNFGEKFFVSSLAFVVSVALIRAALKFLEGVRE